MEEQDEYRHRMTVKIRELRDQANFLEAKLISAELRFKRAERPHESHLGHQFAAENVTELRNSSAEAWDRARGDLGNLRASTKAA